MFTADASARIATAGQRLKIAEDYQKTINKGYERYKLTEEKKQFIENFLFLNRKKLTKQDLALNVAELESLMVALFPELKRDKVILSKLHF